MYTKKTVDYFTNPRNMGRMNDPDASALIKGVCGDTMEMYLVIENQIVKSILFFTDGCESTLACGSSVTEMAKGKSITGILGISPLDVINDLGGLPEEGLHCSILAVSTLHKAVAEYLLREREYHGLESVDEA